MGAKPELFAKVHSLLKQSNSEICAKVNQRQKKDFATMMLDCLIELVKRLDPKYISPFDGINLCSPGALHSLFYAVTQDAVIYKKEYDVKTSLKNEIQLVVNQYDASYNPDDGHSTHLD